MRNSSNSTPLKESLLLNSDRIGEITEDWERLKKSAPPATKVKLQQIAQKIQDSLVKARVSAQEKKLEKALGTKAERLGRGGRVITSKATRKTALFTEEKAIN